MPQTPISEQATQQHEADEEAQWLREHVTEADRERRQLEEEYRKVQTALETTRRESEFGCYRAVDEDRVPKVRNGKPG